MVCTRRESCWGKHATASQLSSRGSGTRIWCLSSCTTAGSEAQAGVFGSCLHGSCSERGAREQKVSREAPSGHTGTLTELKLAKLRGQIKTLSGGTRGCAGPLVQPAGRLFLRHVSVCLPSSGAADVKLCALQRQSARDGEPVVPGNSKAKRNSRARGCATQFGFVPQFRAAGVEMKAKKGRDGGRKGCVFT